MISNSVLYEVSGNEYCLLLAMSSIQIPFGKSLFSISDTSTMMRTWLNEM